MTDEEIENLLPWYVNGTLTEAEQLAVEDLLARSEQARNEETFLRSLAKQVSSETTEPVSDLGWKRLQKAITHQQSNSHQQTGNHQQRKGFNWQRAGLAAAATVIVSLQLGILMDRSNDASIGTRLLGNGAGELQQPYWIFQLEFATKSNWQQLSQLLQKIDARLIDGPSSVGLVRVAVPKDQQQFEDKTELLEWLQQQQLVLHAAIESE